MRRKGILTLAALALLTLALAPLLSADRFRGGIQVALETALGRKVEITGKVRFSVWSGLGFSIGDVVIHEDPRYGIEPFAYVSSLHAGLSLTAALGGRLQVDRIVLDEPVVNLVKLDTGSWNVRPLLASTPAPESKELLPEIRVRSGRLNLKFGDTKSVLYANNADVDITPASETELRIRFSIEPARTDRAAQGIGMLSGQGRYRLYLDKPGELDLEIELERSALSEIATLLEGRGAGLRGFLASRARITGPLSNMKIEGSVRLDDIQRFDLLSAGSGDWPIRYSGRLDFPAGSLELETRPATSAPPFHLRLRASSLWEHPKWGAVARFNELPVEALREVLQYLDVDLPQRVELEGKLSGVLGYSRPHGLQGLVAMDEAKAKTAEMTATLTNAVFMLDRDRFRLQPARLRLGGASGFEIEGSYSPGAQWFAVRSAAPVPLTAVMAACRPFSNPGEIPLLGQFTTGEWRGSLRYEQTGDAPAQWSGSFSIRRASLSMAGLAVPVEIASAHGLLGTSQVRLEEIEGAAGNISFEASYKQEAGAARPHRLHVFAAEADVAELERLFAPTLRRGGLLRTFNLRASIPDWLRQRRADAAVKIGSLWAGESWLGSASARLFWDGARVELTNAFWEREQASATGRMLLSLDRAEPAYQVSLNVKDVGWKGGWIDGEGIFETGGTGSALLRNLKSSGRFYARGLLFSSEGDFRSASGAFELTAPRGAPLLKLTSIEAVSGAETYSGQGASENDGRLFVDLASGRKKMRMAGTVWPFHLEPAAR